MSGLTAARSINVFVGSDGLLRFVYDDELRELLQLGRRDIRRASHVEPTPLGWTADLSPSGGPVLGPFAPRAEAVANEIAWLETQLGSEALSCDV